MKIFRETLPPPAEPDARPERLDGAHAATELGADMPSEKCGWKATLALAVAAVAAAAVITIGAWEATR